MTGRGAWPTRPRSWRTCWGTAGGRPCSRQEPRGGRGSADDLSNRAVYLVDLGRAREAATLWRRALEAEPHHVEATYNASRRLGRRSPERRGSRHRRLHPRDTGERPAHAACTPRSATTSATSPATSSPRRDPDPPIECGDGRSLLRSRRCLRPRWKRRICRGQVVRGVRGHGDGAGAGAGGRDVCQGATARRSDVPDAGRPPARCSRRPGCGGACR